MHIINIFNICKDNKQTHNCLLYVFITAVWVFFHPYNGIWHDGTLYMGQALQHLNPEQFKSDLFFFYGSQDQYTFFSPIYAFVINKVGIHSAAFFMMWISQLLWLISALLLAKQLLKPSMVWFALLLLAILPSYYEPSNTFAYAETFVTARVFSEIFSILGLAFLIVNRSLLSYILLGIAAMLHPIMAMPALIAASVYRLPVKIIGILFFIGATIVLFVIIFPVPWDPLLPMDSHWYAITLIRSPIVFLSQWSNEGVMSIIFWMALLLFAAVISTDYKLYRFWLALLFAGIIGFSLATIASIWPIAILVQMQTWRCAWLIKITGIFALIFIVQTLWQGQKHDHIALAIITTGYLTFNENSSLILFLFSVLYYTKFYQSKYFINQVSNYYKFILITIFLITIPTFLIEIRGIQDNFYSIIDNINNGYHISVIFRYNLSIEFVFFISFMSLMVVVKFYNQALGRLVSIFVVLFFLVLAILTLQHDSSVFYKNVTIPKNTTIPDEVNDIIPMGAVIYSDIDNSLPYIWFHLKRASYMSRQQIAGVVFSRPKAVEALRRIQLTMPFSDSYSIYDADNFLSKNKSIKKFDSDNYNNKSLIKDASLINLCADTSLDYVLLKNPLDGEFGIEPIYTFSSAIRNNNEEVVLKLYDCKMVNALYR